VRGARRVRDARLWPDQPCKGGGRPPRRFAASPGPPRGSSTAAALGWPAPKIPHVPHLCTLGSPGTGRSRAGTGGWSVCGVDAGGARPEPHAPLPSGAGRPAAITACDCQGDGSRHVLGTPGLAAEGATPSEDDDVLPPAVRRQMSSVLRPPRAARSWRRAGCTRRCAAAVVHSTRGSLLGWRDGGDTQGGESRIGPLSPGRRHHDTQRPCVVRRHAHSQLAAAAGWAAI
jgi:hypothetical protein